MLTDRSEASVRRRSARSGWPSRDIFAPLAERGHLNIDATQAVIQVRPEQAASTSVDSGRLAATTIRVSTRRAPTLNARGTKTSHMLLLCSEQVAIRVLALTL
jgi:hypothetical protein